MTRAVVGLRALTADLLPAVGRLSDRTYVAVTHSGITLAPALGELVAAEVLGRRRGAAARTLPPRSTHEE